ncbi:MAG: 30S ribosomal protein S16, partial [Patescibacteria group bacterium]
TILGYSVSITLMLKIRLQRVGRKAEPVFRLVLTDSKNSTKSGKSLEILGNYDARRGENSVFKADRISHWLSKGAQASGTVHNLLVSKKIVEGKKVNVLPLKKAIVKDVPVEAAAPAPAPKAEEVATEAPVEATPAVEEAATPTETEATA